MSDENIGECDYALQALKDALRGAEAELLHHSYRVNEAEKSLALGNALVTEAKRKIESIKAAIAHHG